MNSIQTNTLINFNFIRLLDFELNFIHIYIPQKVYKAWDDFPVEILAALIIPKAFEGFYHGSWRSF